MANTFLAYDNTTNTWSFSDEQGNSWRWRGDDQEVLAKSSVRDWLRILFDSVSNPSGPLAFDATRQEWTWETHARVRTVPRSRELLVLLDECVILHLRTSFQAKSSQSAIAESNHDSNHVAPFSTSNPSSSSASHIVPLSSNCAGFFDFGHQADASMADDPFTHGAFRTNGNTQSYQVLGDGAAFPTLCPSGNLTSSILPINNNRADLFDFGPPAPAPQDTFMADDRFEEEPFGNTENTLSSAASPPSILPPRPTPAPHDTFIAGDRFEDGPFGNTENTLSSAASPPSTLAPRPAPTPHDTFMADDRFEDGPFGNNDHSLSSATSPSSTLVSRSAPAPHDTFMADHRFEDGPFGNTERTLSSAASPSSTLAPRSAPAPHDTFMADDQFEDQPSGNNDHSLSSATSPPQVPAPALAPHDTFMAVDHFEDEPSGNNGHSLSSPQVPPPASAPQQDTSMLDDCFEDGNPFCTNDATLPAATFSCPLPAPRILGSNHTPRKTSTNSFITRRRGINSPTTSIIDDQDDTRPSSSVSSPDRIDTPCPTRRKTLRKLLDARRPGRKDRAQNGFEFVNVPASCFTATT
ncbi:hypothetical protein AC579_7459 [Pseudocercospora musae]|uniref:Uncharacterized protein n=2 Tax=Pseudocercospora musae TaxID=113226 RepID=A0A139H7K6_9PEZI|nr:hypothetical protein AC579_7459 [Pseudocercospora musae]